MLFPSQRRAAEQLRQRADAGAGAVVLRGLSGVGKSTVAEFAVAAPRQIVDAGYLRTEVHALRQAVADGVRTVILAQPHDDVKGSGITTHPQEVHLGGLSASELHAWLDGHTPLLHPDEHACIAQYCLGIPFLVERMLVARPITPAAARIFCAAYLQSLIDQSSLYGDDYCDQLSAVLRGETGVANVPDDVLPLLASAQPFGAAARPLQLLNQRLHPSCTLPFPESAQLFSLYQTWLVEHPHEPTFDVLVDHIQSPEHLLEALGYCEFPERRTALLSAFIMADTRKGAVCAPDTRGPQMHYQLNHAGECSVDWMNARLLELARASGIDANVATLPSSYGKPQIAIAIPSLSAPLYMHKHDHTPSAVMPVAYTIECELQRRGLAYSVRLSDRSYRYDPARQTYADLPKLDVQYFHEAHGWPLDDLPEEDDAQS